MENTYIIETVTYRTKDGVEDAAYIKAAEGLNAHIDRTGGLMSRCIFKDDEGLWHETMVWKDLASYETVNKGFMASAEGQAVVALINPETLKMGHSKAAFVRVDAPEMA